MRKGKLSSAGRSFKQKFKASVKNASSKKNGKKNKSNVVEKSDEINNKVFFGKLTGHTIC